MRRHQRICMWSLGFVFSLSVASGLVTIAAAHTIDAVTVTPAVVVLEEGAAVTVTAEIADKDVFQRSVHVQQQGTDGQWRIAGLMEKTDKTRWTYTQGVSTTDVLRLRVGAIFRQPWEVVVSSAHLVRVGQVVEPAEETIVSGPEGVQLRVLPGALNVPAVLTVAPVPTEEVAAPLGSRPVVAAVDVVVEPVEDLPGLIYLVDQPFELSLPLPEGLSATDQFYVAVQGLADVVDEGQEGIAPRLIVVDTGVVEDDRIVSQATDLAGIFSSGRYVVQQKIGSGFVEGVVRDDEGNPRGGVFVHVTSDVDSANPDVEIPNPEVFYTDAEGRYKLVINGDTFEVTAEDVLGCTRGKANGTLPVADATVTADINVLGLFLPPLPRPGVRNGGMEVGNRTCVRADADAPFAGPITGVPLIGVEGVGNFVDFSGTPINVLEGSQMMAAEPVETDLTYVTGGTGGGATFQYSFTIPPGFSLADTLFLNVNYGCLADDCPPSLGPGDPRLDDIFHINLLDSTDTLLSGLDVSASDVLGSWSEDLEIPIGQFIGQNPGKFTLQFTHDINLPNQAPTFFLLDNLRFNTIWLDVKIVEGSRGDAARVRQNVRDANEILSQTGLNVRIRNIQFIADPGDLVDLDVTLIDHPVQTQKDEVTEETAELLGLARSATNTDINVYYVRSLTGLGSTAWGIAIGPDDYVLANPLAERGIILADLVSTATDPAAPLSPLNAQDLDRELLAHELGHLLIPFAVADGDREHNVEVTNPDTGLPEPDTTNIMQSTRCKAPEVIDLDDPTQPCYARTFFNTEQTEFIQMPSLDTDFIDPTNP